MGTEQFIARAAELLWTGALAATPVAAGAGAMCRVRRLRPSTRHLLCRAIQPGPGLIDSTPTAPAMSFVGPLTSGPTDIAFSECPLSSAPEANAELPPAAPPSTLTLASPAPPVVTAPAREKSDVHTWL